MSDWVSLEELMVRAYLFLSHSVGSSVSIVHEGGSLATLVFAQNDVQHCFDGKNRRLSNDAREVRTTERERIGP